MATIVGVVEDVFVRLESGSGGVFGEVAKEAVVLGLMTDEVIKGVLLPEATSGAEVAVELGANEAFPGLTLRQHRLPVWKGDEQVQVVRHDDERVHLIADAIEMEKAVADEGGAFGVS